MSHLQQPTIHRRLSFLAFYSQRLGFLFAITAGGILLTRKQISDTLPKMRLSYVVFTVVNIYHLEGLQKRRFACVKAVSSSGSVISACDKLSQRAGHIASHSKIAWNSSYCAYKLHKPPVVQTTTFRMPLNSCIAAGVSQSTGRRRHDP